MTPGQIRMIQNDPHMPETAAEFARHQHWCDVHRLCAVCGKYVASGESGDLECAVNDGSIAIHPDYNDYFQTIKRGDISRLLIVHRSCTQRNLTR
jgi:hypothetical protein